MAEMLRNGELDKIAGLYSYWVSWIEISLAIRGDIFSVEESLQLFMEDCVDTILLKAWL